MIELAQPARVWWLLAGVLVLLLAVPPRPHRILLTAHLPQWRAALVRCRRTPLRYPWLRVLLLLASFALAVLAWSGPRRPATPGPTRLRVVVDASASMAARSGDGRAYDELLATLRGGLRRLPPHVRAHTLFVRCDRDVHFVGGSVGATVDDERDRSVEGVDGLGDPARCALGVRLARVARAALAPDTAVWTLTDGRSGLPDVGALSVVGRPAGNLALTALRVDDRWPLPDVEVEVEVANFTDAARELRLRLDGAAAALVEVPELAPVRVAAGGREVVRFAARRGQGGELRVEIDRAGDSADALVADDAVGCVLPAPPAPRIAVLSDSDAPVLRAAAAALAAETGGEIVDVRSADARAGYVLVEGGSQRAEDWRGLRGLLFGTELLGDDLAATDAGRSDAAIEWRRDDPLTAGLDFSELRLTQAPVPIGGQALVTAGGQPLIAVRPGRRAVQCAFRLTDANLWLLPAFPQLLRRAYAAAHAEVAAVRLAADNLVDAAESDLRSWPGGAVDRPLPTWGTPALDLTAWFALAALVCLLARAGLTRAA